MIVKVYHCKNFLIDNINKKKKNTKEETLTEKMMRSLEERHK